MESLEAWDRVQVGCTTILHHDTRFLQTKLDILFEIWSLLSSLFIEVGQMSPKKVVSVVSNSCDIVDIEFVRWVVGGRWGVCSHFCAKPNFCFVSLS